MRNIIEFSDLQFRFECSGQTIYSYLQLLHLLLRMLAWLLASCWLLLQYCIYLHYQR